LDAEAEGRRTRSGLTLLRGRRLGRGLASPSGESEAGVTDGTGWSDRSGTSGLCALAALGSVELDDSDSINQDLFRLRLHPWMY